MESDPDQLVELSVFSTGLEAQLLVARLEEAGIEGRAFATASEGLGFMSSTTFPHGGTQVLVRRADAERATEILAEFQSERADNEDA